MRQTTRLGPKALRRAGEAEKRKESEAPECGALQTLREIVTINSNGFPPGLFISGIPASRGRRGFGFKRNRVLDLDDTGNTLGDLSGAALLVFSSNETAELNDSIERFDVHIGELIDRLVIQVGLDPRRDSMVIDHSALAAVARGSLMVALATS
jgi:hypothetical protein